MVGTASRRTFILNVAAAAATSKLTKGATQRPNFLFLLPDQWRYDWMDGTPNLPIRMPNLRALAARGVRFTHTSVASPLCAPSRACLASGKQYDRCGVLGNNQNYSLSQRTYYHLLREAGYHVVGCGKMDLHKATLDWGLDGKRCLSEWGFSDGIDNEGKIDALLSGGEKLPKGPYMVYLHQQGFAKTHCDDMRKRLKEGYPATYPTPVPDESYCDNWIAQNGLKLLRNAPQNRPWHLVVNFTGPHDPEDITFRMEKLCRDRNFPPPNESSEYDAKTHNTIRQNYTAMCENIDRLVGLFMKELHDRGEMGNTIVIFSSDHGEMLGDHNRWGKTVPYEASVRVPLIVSGPAVKAGKTSDVLISHIDIGATILDYAGVDDLPDVDRKSFRPVLEGKAKEHRDVVISGLGSWRMVADRRYKYIKGFDPLQKPRGDVMPQIAISSSSPPKSSSVPDLLFDLQADPLERHNVAADFPEIASKLSSLLPVTPS